MPSKIGRYMQWVSDNLYRPSSCCRRAARCFFFRYPEQMFQEG